MSSPPRLAPNHHRCPRRGCRRVVGDRFFACRADWYALPHEIRDRIRRTAGRLSRDRLDAIHAAHSAWERQP